MRWSLVLILSALGAALLGYESVHRPATVARLSELAGDAGRARHVPSRGADGAAISSAAHDSNRIAAVRAALALSKDELRCEHDLYLALDGATAADFAALTREPDGLLVLGKKQDALPHAVRQALVDGVIERWLAVDERGALAWFRGGDGDFKNSADVRTLAAETLARLRPESVFERVISLPGGQARKRLASVLIKGIVESDARRLAQWVARFPEGELRDAAEREGRRALTRIDPLAAVEGITPQMTEKEANEVWSDAVSAASARSKETLRALAAKTDDVKRRLDIAQAMADRDPEEAARIFSEAAARLAAERRDLLDRPDAAHFVCIGLARRDPLRAAEWADTLPGAMRTRALAEVASLWSARDPAAAMTWLAAHPAIEPIDIGRPPRKVTDVRTEALAAWLKRDETGARAWIDAMPQNGGAQVFTGQLVSHLVTTGRATEAAEIFARLDSSKRSPLAAEIAGKWAGIDPESAATWAVELPEGREQQKAIAGAVSGWAGRDPAAVAAWIEDFPAGPPKDHALGSFAQTVASKDPPAAAEWVAQIADPWRRGDAAATVFWNWHFQDRETAHEWLRALPGMDETRRQQLLEDSRLSP